MKRSVLLHTSFLPFALVTISCAQQGATSAAATPDRTSPPPWQQRALSSSAVPAVYVQQWSRAANRSSCALLAFADPGEGTDATPRAATFSGGWAVAYDRADLRSAFGIAGTGASASDSGVYSAWPFHIAWSGGSSAGYGPEGGTGPNQLAYLKVAGQDCLYNVWSRISREHLEFLLQQLRRVDVVQ